LKILLLVYIHFSMGYCTFQTMALCQISIPKILCPHAKQQAFGDWYPKVMFLDL